MENIIKIYDNAIGISFQWTHIETDLTQIIFRDIGFHLSEEELELFTDKITEAKFQKQCKNCDMGPNCKSILLQTPLSKVTLAVSLSELQQIEDLLKGTLFQVKLNKYINDICKN
ncbi:hypothetical protein [Tenacibaculum geojense]|uniref:Uncharacterized protein n=1 Tax=Tenacibaculum geojense TaxID=915352 RepID=A0ABW3JTS9_9FLAO